jgi:NAD(P)H-hydrate epimerase
VGQLLVADIGIADQDFPPNLPEVATATLIAGLLPERPIFGHKGSFGKVLVTAGSANYAGAPALSARAAYRAGAGLVTVAVPASIQPVIAANVIEATYLLLAHEEGAIAEAAAAVIGQALGGYGALLVGPGLGTAPTTGRFFNALLDRLVDYADDLPPCIFDADALNLLAKEAEWWTQLPPSSILTPHPGEMSRLTGMSIQAIEADRLNVATAMAQRWQQIVVLTGAYTIVASPGGEVVVLPFANPALATAGSGDVLAGCILGLLGQKLAPFDAAVAGAYLHGLAGEMAREALWEAGVMAGDLLDRLPLALKEITLG